jgi:retinol-binding protein 3
MSTHPLPDPDMNIPGEILAIVESVLGKIQAYYVFPDTASLMAQTIRTHLAAGEYYQVATFQLLCDLLTSHLQAVSRDKHVSVSYSFDPLPSEREEQAPTPEDIRIFRLQGSIRNFGFEKVERLAGNIGYLDLRTFFSVDYAGDTAVSAMNCLANTHALIIDLRQNTGGCSAMAALLSSYLFGESVLLHTAYSREDSITEQIWTLPYVPGRRYQDRPVYVLIGATTFSAAEAFAYELKNRRRATLVGEVTRGGAHPISRYRVNAHVEVVIPTERVVSAITHTDWEGIGVIPDMRVPEEDALRTAYRAALKEVLETVGVPSTEPLKELLQEVQTALHELAAT